MANSLASQQYAVRTLSRLNPSAGGATTATPTHHYKDR